MTDQQSPLENFATHTQRGRKQRLGVGAEEGLARRDGASLLRAGDGHFPMARRATCAGLPAGQLNTEGHRQIAFRGRDFVAGRLAGVMFSGAWPPHFIDHENCERDDNRWRNLRIATPAQNARNRRIRKQNKAGFKGVHWNAEIKKWEAFIAVEKKQRRLGYFPSPELAHQAYCLAARELHGEFARYG